MKYKRKEIAQRRAYLVSLFFSFFPYLFLFKPQNLEPFTITQTMGAKRTLRSSSSKAVEPLTPKINRPLLGGDENPSIEEQWIIPPFFEDYLFDKSFDWDFVPCSSDPLYMECGELDDMLTMDLDLKHIPQLGTCR